MKKYNVKLLSGKTIKVKAYSKNHAHGQASRHGMVSSVTECNSVLWGVVGYLALVAVGAGFFYQLSGQL